MSALSFFSNRRKWKRGAGRGTTSHWVTIVRGNVNGNVKIANVRGSEKIEIAAEKSVMKGQGIDPVNGRAIGLASVRPATGVVTVTDAGAATGVDPAVAPPRGILASIQTIIKRLLFILPVWLVNPVN